MEYIIAIKRIILYLNLFSAISKFTEKNVLTITFKIKTGHYLDNWGPPP